MNEQLLSRLKLLVNDPKWEVFEEYLDYQKDIYYKSLLNANQLEEVNKCRYFLLHIEKLKALELEINSRYEDLKHAR